MASFNLPQAPHSSAFRLRPLGYLAIATASHPSQTLLSHFSCDAAGAEASLLGYTCALITTFAFFLALNFSAVLSNAFH